ncbi:alpha/beta fold hydrolase [Sphingomonas sp. FW199]|uniref:alpha/beta fold hydrolase n=1 Tax=Sphingomonas sp. FW199 TaxID=3400217 RepID=UPI003CEF366E
MPIAMNPVTVMHRGRTLRGTHYGKADAEPVVIAHGFSDSRIGPGRLIVDLARTLAGSGFAVWAFDRAGHGESDGSLADVSVPDEIEQLAAMLALVGGHPHLIGHSLGGMELATLAGRMPDAVATLTLMAPAAASADDVRQGRVLGRPVDPLKSGQSIDIDGQALGAAFVEGMAGYDPYAGLDAFAGPVFLHHGLDDAVVAPAYSQRYAETFPNAHLTHYAGADHSWAALGPRRTLINTCVRQLASARRPVTG